MAKRKTNTTADLIVRHIHRHLQREVRAAPRFPKLNFRGLEKFQITSTALFACAAVFTLLVSYQLVKISMNADNSAFIAKDAQDYAAQTAFYTGETMHSAADFSAAREAVASAARASELAEASSVLGFALVITLFWYLHREYGLFSMGPHFRIRRIR